MGDLTQLLMEEASSEDQDVMEGIMASLDDVLMSKNNVMVDQSPLQPQLQKNKESLEKKLMSRRPMTTLVEQGIVPEYKTSPSLHVQRTKLERAKTGDILKSKISHRPERTELVHRHILEDVRPDVDPSLCDRQRQLKRAKLADSLASQLSHRPGPLELIQKNILHTDEPVEQALKEGTLHFRPTADGSQARFPYTFDEDSSDTVPSPQVDTAPSPQVDYAPSPQVDNSVFSPVPRDTSSPNVAALLAQFSDISGNSRSARSESLGDITSVQARIDHEDLAKCDIFGGSGGDLSLFTSPNQHREAPGKERKKLKAKSVTKPGFKPGTAPKPTSFKFHEYKGPPESLKRKKPEKKKDQSSYDLLLEQQQIYLQWQLENRNKYPQILLPAPVKQENGRSSTMSVGTSSTSGYMSGASSSCTSLVTSPTSSLPGTPRSATPREQTPTRLVTLTPQDVNNATALLHKLDAMKASDLKIELKKRNLPVSGSKTALIEKLKPTLEAVIAAGKKQFKQPYKQIQIASGGLIILKPSPNSQILTSSEATKEMTPVSPGTPGMMHEGTPEMEETSSSSLPPLVLPLSGDPTMNSLSLLGLLSPSESVQSLGNNSEIEAILSERRDSLHSLHSTEAGDFTLLMDIEPQGGVMPPPVPPPPPPPQPQPLPGPPSVLSVPCPLNTQQFLPPQQTSQQILLAKAALEAQISSESKQNFQPSKNTKAGPKGQFIWPPVSVQSPSGALITIRAVTSSEQQQPPVRNETIVSSRPVSQLAAVFSQSQANTLPTNLPIMNVKLPQQPVPPAELGLNLNSLPATLPAANSNHALSEEKETGDFVEDIIKAQQQRIAELERALNERSQPEAATASQQSNTKLLLAQQIINKQQLRQPAEHSQSMDEVIDSLLKTEDLPESVQNFGVKVPDKPPNPPPLPQKNSPMEFPQLDLADMSFDFGLDNDFETMLEDQHNKVNGVNNKKIGDTMDVDMDMDVQDWLDSLVVPPNPKLHSDLSHQFKDKKNDINTWTHGV